MSEQPVAPETDIGTDSETGMDTLEVAVAELRPALAVGATVDARYLAALTPPAQPNL